MARATGAPRQQKPEAFRSPLTLVSPTSIQSRESASAIDLKGGPNQHPIIYGLLHVESLKCKTCILSLPRPTAAAHVQEEVQELGNCRFDAPSPLSDTVADLRLCRRAGLAGIARNRWNDLAALGIALGATLPTDMAEGPLKRKFIFR